MFHGIDYLEVGNNDLQKCKSCNDVIPEEVNRFRFYYSDGSFMKTLTFCPHCFCKMYKHMKDYNKDKQSKAYRRLNKKLTAKQI